MDSNKIFIDTDSEITFVLERVLNTRSERVVLVVPDRAALLSSITGLKLIKRVIDKSNKLLVLVTLDDIGAQQASNAGLLVVSRVGEIDETLWEKAQKLKFEVIKKSKRSHYVPEIIEEDLKTENAHHTSIKEEGAKVNLADIVEVKSDTILEDNSDEDDENDTSLEISEESQNNVDDRSEIPQVRINVDLKEVQEEREEIQENLYGENNDRPTFLSSDSDVKPEYEKLNLEELEILEDKPTTNTDYVSHHQEEKIVDQQIEENSRIEDEPKIRIRRTAPKNSGISNLTFAFGKDITNEKKN